MVREETICAIATAPGSAAIAMLRVSGPNAFHTVDTIFRPARRFSSVSNAPAYTIQFGQIKKDNEIIDEVLVSVFKQPHSYTGEDSVEITCHASSYIQQEILKLLIQNGARLADPGEFTLRAYVNGKMDLSQAEAVADIIASQSEAAHRLAFSQLRGGYSVMLQELRSKLLEFSALIELELDFSEEDVEFADRSALVELCEHIKDALSTLVDSFSTGNAVKNGIPVAIVGEPNAGKSTLLNALLNEERAIVSEIPGTTRDVIEDHITIQGIWFRFIDTAGIRQTTDTVENIGIRKTFEKIEQASIVLLLTDVNTPITDLKIKIEEVQSKISGKAHLYVLLNKTDKVDTSFVQQRVDELISLDMVKTENIIEISAKHHRNLQVLKDRLIHTVNLGTLSHHDAIVTNARHYEALSNALDSINRVEDGLKSDLPGDLVALEIRQVLFFLGEITGNITNDETLGFIFKNFCIGK